MIDLETKRAVLTMIQRGLVTVPEAARLAGVQRQLVRYWCRRARIVPAKARDGLLAKQWRKVLNEPR
ncbi:MAG: hypothetical protein EPN91_05580 [Salinibacterium sp.]|nr:MAG: hypothetical protein EPN91_05580 [Salinibacterium sp.]